MRGRARCRCCRSHAVRAHSAVVEENARKLKRLMVGTSQLLQQLREEKDKVWRSCCPHANAAARTRARCVCLCVCRQNAALGLETGALRERLGELEAADRARAEADARAQLLQRQVDEQRTKTQALQAQLRQLKLLAADAPEREELDQLRAERARLQEAHDRLADDLREARQKQQQLKDTTKERIAQAAASLKTSVAEVRAAATTAAPAVCSHALPVRLAAGGGAEARERAAQSAGRRVDQSGQRARGRGGGGGG